MVRGLRLFLAKILWPGGASIFAEHIKHLHKTAPHARGPPPKHPISPERYLTAHLAEYLLRISVSIMMHTVESTEVDPGCGHSWWASWSVGDWVSVEARQ